MEAVREDLISALVLPVGITARPATLADIPQIVEMLNDICESLKGTRPRVEENLHSWMTAPKFDPATSTILLFAGDDLAGYAVIWDNYPIPYKVWINMGVRPRYRDGELGMALHRWAEMRGQWAIERVPAEARVTLVDSALSIDQQALDLLEKAGYVLKRYFWRMSIMLDDKTEIPEPVLPEGIEIVPWSAVETRFSLRDIAKANNEGFKDHWGHTEQPLDDMVKEWTHWFATAKYMTADSWFLALDGDEIAGVSLCEDMAQGNPEWGYLDSLTVLRPWRRKGLALALLQHTFRHYQERGFKRVDLHVDAASLTGATRLYEKAGMHMDEQSNAYQKVLRDGKDMTVQSVEA